MKLTFRIPFRCYIVGPTENSLKLSVIFKHSSYIVRIEFLPYQNEKPLDMMKLSKVYAMAANKEDRYWLKTEYILFYIEPQSCDARSLECFNELCHSAEKQERFFSLLIEISNKTFRSMRNFGLVSSLHHINPHLSEADKYFEFWEAQFSKNGQSFKSLINKQKTGLRNFLSGLESPISSTYSCDIPEIKVNFWPEISEALQDNSEPPPEFEFMINAREFLELRNFRMALAESIIGLEIVLTQYLRSYLEIKKKLSKERIDNFITPNLGLNARVSVLLEFILNESLLKDINIDKILCAISWRNKVIHKTGNLPNNIKKDVLEKCINEVITLSLKLAQAKRQIEAEPDLQSIAKETSTDKIPMPYIKIIGKHFIKVDFDFSFKEIPERDILESLVKQLNKKLIERDKRFDANKHLLVRFLKFPNKVQARWKNGSLEIIKTEKVTSL